MRTRYPQRFRTPTPSTKCAQVSHLNTERKRKRELPQRWTHIVASVGESLYHGQPYCWQKASQVDLQRLVHRWIEKISVYGLSTASERQSIVDPPCSQTCEEELRACLWHHNNLARVDAAVDELRHSKSRRHPHLIMQIALPSCRACKNPHITFVILRDLTGNSGLVHGIDP